MMPHTGLGDATTLYVLGVVLLATLVRSTIGFGEALVAVPLLALRIPIAIAAPLAVLVSVLVAALIVVRDWRQIEVRAAAGLIASSLLGIPIGVLLLVRVNDGVVRAALGIVIASFAAYSLVAKRLPRLETGERAWLVAAGFLSGVLGGAYGMNGPPLAIYGSMRGWSPQQFRATLQGYFLAASLAGLAAYLAAGIWRPAITRYSLLSLPLVCVGVAVGHVLNRRLHGPAFFRAVYLGLVVIGLVLLQQAITR